ncbi:hypothetical protein AAC387_Pa11g0094 [Persea americana]
MTAEAVVSLVVGKLCDLMIEEAQLLLGVSDQFEWIQRQLKGLQSFLKDAHAKQKRNARVRNWVQEIRDVAYDAEDIIDSFILGQADRRGLTGHVKRYIFFVGELRARHKVGEQIQQIKLRITDLSSNKQTFEINVIEEGRQLEASSSIRTLHDRRWHLAHFEEPDIVGMQEDMKTLKDRLIDGNPKRRVVSIVGMGGSGKTTLAKQVSSEVKNKFQCHAFIYVSQHYTRREIWTRLIKSVMMLKPETGEIEKLSDEELGEKLRGYLTGRRYLVVIDDVWSKDAWDTLKDMLPDSLNQSRVMLTTRNKDVAAHADPSSTPHEIRLLNDEEGWELFMKKTFLGKDTDAPIVCPEELEAVGRQIFVKCSNLPLAIVVLGGLLSRRDAILSAWSKVLENVTRRLAESSNQLMEILALSYYDLPYYLKPCFLYLGLFPEDHEISSRRLIRLWIAEGFISQEGGGIKEDLAEGYLDDLIGRSMIQVTTKRTNGTVRTCRIHDLLRELSISEAKDNKFFAIQADNDTNTCLTSVRRLALYHSTEMHEIINHPTATLRSMLCFSDPAIHFSKLLNRGGKLLRLLDMVGEMMARRKVPKNIGEFVHLRYLSLRGYAIKSLPSSIGKLSNLLTLELTYTGILPNEIYNLGRLRHLHTYYYDIQGRSGLHKLRNLQTLCLSAGSWIEGCLQKLTNLRKLGISGDLTRHHKALSDSIEKLYSLRSLKLIDGNSIPQYMSFTHHSHLDKMFFEGRINILPEFPPSLAMLTLSKSELGQDAIATLENLPRLKILRLLAGSYCSEIMICSPGGFRRLEFLVLDCSNLREWIAEEVSMPSLKSVELLNNDHLRTFPESVRHLLRSDST